MSRSMPRDGMSGCAIPGKGFGSTGGSHSSACTQVILPVGDFLCLHEGQAHCRAADGSSMSCVAGTSIIRPAACRLSTCWRSHQPRRDERQDREDAEQQPQPGGRPRLLPRGLLVRACSSAALHFRQADRDEYLLAGAPLRMPASQPAPFPGRHRPGAGVAASRWRAGQARRQTALKARRARCPGASDSSNRLRTCGARVSCVSRLAGGSPRPVPGGASTSR